MAVRKRRRLGIGPASRGTKIDGLDAFQRHRRARQRAEDEEQRVDRQAPQHAVVQRLGDGAEQRLRPQSLEAEQADATRMSASGAASEGRSSV